MDVYRACVIAAHIVFRQMLHHRHLLTVVGFAVCQMFPKLDIRNVVEATEEVTIKNWCGFGLSSCHHHEFSVRPFRCLGMTDNPWIVILVIGQS